MEHNSKSATLYHSSDGAAVTEIEIMGVSV
jgi:hypothetical protein